MPVKSIHLTRYFMLCGIIVVVAAGLILTHLNRSILTDQLKMMAEHNNLALTQAFANSLWRPYSDFLNSAGTLSPEEVRKHEKTGEFFAAVRDLMAGTRVLKVKVYDLGGNTVFSTQEDQIGADYSQNPRYLTALGGGTASKLEFRETFQSISGPVPDRWVMSSYIPVQMAPGKPVEGVVEIYSDVTDFQAQVSKAARLELSFIAISLFVVFALLTTMIWRADRLIRRSHKRHVELAASAAMANAASQAKSEFVANMSHELRTPLNAILGFSEMIRSMPDRPDAAAKDQEYARDIHRAGTHLLDIIGAVLDMAKAETGKLNRSLSSVDAGEVAADVVDMLVNQATTRGVDLTYEVPTSLAPLCSDESKVRQILINLVSNAIKFTPAGGRVRLVVSQQDPRGPTCFEVIDTGIGMRAQDIPTALSPFGQIDSSFTREYEGTGLGLPLSRKFVELLEGRLEIRSRPGSGTTVAIILPATVREPGSNETVPHAEAA
ncbi:MAG: HAMP domain-containing histidine kinase [Proteobacteria bacterium]|nr:HAMP domain-containing histidine kinase [Pseudomonadota bacterium]